MNEAISALESHNYALEDGAYVLRGAHTLRPKTRYLPSGDGFRRFEWEKEQWRAYPHNVLEAYRGMGGFTFDDQGNDPNAKVMPQFFDWIYPAEEVVRIYAAQE